MFTEKENARAGEQRAGRKNKHRHNNKPSLNFKAINYAAMAVLPVLLGRWLPDGKRIGNEWIARNPRRANHHAGSFKINMRNGKWADFATNDRGVDVISLAAYIAGVSQSEAARRLVAMLGVRHD